MHPVEVMRWVDAYERAWRAGDLDALETLFTDQARYRFSPYEESQVGHAAIKGFCQDDDDVVFTMTAAPVAVGGWTLVRASGPDDTPSRPRLARRHGGVAHAGPETSNRR